MLCPGPACSSPRAELLDAAYEQVPAAPVRSGFEMARTRLVYGERLRRAGRRTEAREHLRGALGVFHAIGAEPWERRAQTELRASGARLRRPDTSPRDELTPQELQVALVVADGVTNREAAARLFLSPKTIEVHLSRAYRKLGVRTRTELSRRIALHRAADSSLAPVRTLSTVLCTGLVNRTDEAAGPGDKRQAVSPAPHNQEIAAAVSSNGGQIVRAVGDGVLAMFDAPSAALHCAFDICAAAATLTSGRAQQCTWARSTPSLTAKSAASRCESPSACSPTRALARCWSPRPYGTLSTAPR